MLLGQKMRSLATAAVLFSCIAITLASATESDRPSICCTEVSTNKITVPITGFMVQQPRPPCVKAVVFFTAKGPMCSHWRETWVRDKVTELRRLQAIGKTDKMNTTTTTTV